MIFKNKFVLFTPIFLFALFSFVSVHKAQADTCTALPGNWNAGTTWVNSCGHIPTSSDDVIIPAGVTVTINTAGAVANTVDLLDPVNASNGVTIASPGTLTVTDVVITNGSTGSGNSTIAVADGALTASNIAIDDGNGGTGSSILSVSTGSVTLTSNVATSGINFSGFNTAHRQVTVTGAGTITTTGTITYPIFNGGTVSLNSASTLAITGTGSQILKAYTYGNLVINKPSGTVTADASATITVAGNLTVTSGTLDFSSSNFTVTGTTTVGTSGTLLFSSSTNGETFNGDVINNGIWNETTNVGPIFAGSFINNGSLTSVGGFHVFSGSTKTIGGTKPIVIPSVSISGSYTNTGTLTALTLLTIGGNLANNGTITTGTTLTGAGGIGQGANSILNIGGTSTIVTFTAVNSGNTVSYTAAGAQTVIGVLYNNLTLSGSGVKTVTSVSANNNYIVVMGGHNYNVMSGSTATSINIGASTLVVVVPSGTFTLHSPDSFLLADSASDASTCNPTNFYNSITLAPGTVTITPDTTNTCFVNGGGGGQLNMTKSTVPVTSTVNGPAVTSTPSATSTTPNGMSALPIVTVPVVTTPVIAATSVVTTPSAAMKMTVPKTVTAKSPKASIQVLQNALNLTLRINLSIDGKWGAKTTAAIKKFQTSMKLKADGKVGPLTSAKLNASM